MLRVQGYVINNKKGIMEIHDKIKQLRMLHKFSLQALAEKVGTTKSQIDKLEKGERRLTVEWILRLAKALEVHPAVFFAENLAYAENNDSEKRKNILEDSVAGAYKMDTELQPDPADSVNRSINLWGKIQHDIDFAEKWLPLACAFVPVSEQLVFLESPQSFLKRPVSLQGALQAFAIYAPAVYQNGEKFIAKGQVLYVDPAAYPIDKSIIAYTQNKFIQIIEKPEDMKGFFQNKQRCYLGCVAGI